MEMLYGGPFEKITFLSRIDTNSGFGRDWDNTLWKKFHNSTFIALQMKVFGHKKFQIPCTGSKVPNWQFLKWHIWSRAIEIFCGQIPSFEVLWMCHYWTFSIMCLSFFQIQNLCQFWAKRWFSQKDIHTAFPFLFPSVLLSC